MQIRLGSQSGNRPPKSGHHVVWEKVPGEISISGPLPRATSVQQDPFPEFLKEEWFSDQSSLLREMNDAVVALSKELKLQGPADPVPAGDVSLRPWEDTTMHGTAPGALQETLASLSSQETLQGDLLQEGPAQAALGAQDVTPAGASESAGHRTAQERGGEQGESPKGAGQGQEDTQSIFFVQGQGTATEEQTLEESEDLQGAQGESTEAGAQVLTEVEEAGLTQEKTGWEATRPPGDAEKAVLTQGENLDADLRPAEPQELELALGGCFTAGVLRWAAAQEERVQPLSKGAELGEEADSCMLRSEKLELKLGEHLDPEVQCLGEAGRPGAVPGESPSTDLQLLAAGQDVEAEQAGSGDADGLEVAQTLQLAPTEGQSVGLAAWPSEAQSPGATQGHVLDAGMPLTQAQMPEAKQGESNDAACQHEAEEGEVTQSVEAELQPGAEAAVGDAAPGGRGDAGLQPGDEGEQLDVVQGGSAGPAVQPPEEAEPLDVMQEEEAGADVQPVEEAKSAGGLQGQSSDANVQSLAEAEELAFTPGEGTEAELQPPSEAAVGGRGDAGLQPGDEGEQLDVVQGGSAGPALQPPEEAEPLDVMQEEEAGADVQPVEEAKSAGGLQGQSSDANVQSLAEAEELAFTPGEGTEAELQPPSEAGSPVLYRLGVRPGEGDAAGVQPPKVDESLGAWEALSPDVKVLPLIVVEEPKFTLSESVVADLGPLGTAQTWEGMPGQILALEAHAFPQGDLTDGAAHAEVQPLAGAATQGAQPHDQAIANTETPDLEVMLGAFAGADGQILEETQILEITQGERVDACAQAAEGAQKLKVVQTEKIHPEFLPQAPGALNGEKTQGKSADLEIYSLETPKAEVMQGDKTSADVQEEPKEMMLGESTGPALYSFKIHGVEMLQGERTNAEVRPLDEVQDLEVVQGASLEADVRFFTQTEGLQLKQGCNAGAAMVASSISEVPLPIRGQKHETLTQEDVLVPDLQRLGILGQEQVSTQADKVRPDVAPEQLLPKEKPLRVMESEQIAAEHPELPKEKVPPASTLCARVRREEHMGSDPVGAFLGDSLLSDVANSRTQPLTRLSGEPGNGLDVGQRDGKQDVRLQTSQEVKPSPEDPGAVMADGARSSAGVTPETWPDPDHLYNVLFVGDSHVGKTSFLYRLHANSFNPHLTATVGLDYQIKNLIVDNKLFALRLWDSAGQERYHSITKQFFRKADGVVLMYDITSEYSFADVRYWLSCIQEGAEDGIAILLLGNKTDCAAERQVPTKEGERLAQEHQLTFYECSAASGHNVSESMVSLIRLLKIRDDQLKSKVEEEPKPTQKKKGCC
nr:PREDICTED: ras-related protein Rab-44 isoform X1 [Struthio camelus australis]